MDFGNELIIRALKDQRKNLIVNGLGYEKNNLFFSWTVQSEMILGNMGDVGLLSGPSLMGPTSLPTVTPPGSLSLGPPSPNPALPSFGFTQEQVCSFCQHSYVVVTIMKLNTQSRQQ